jgi:hypothetical protein
MGDRRPKILTRVDVRTRHRHAALTPLGYALDQSHPVRRIPDTTQP